LLVRHFIQHDLLLDLTKGAYLQNIAYFLDQSYLSM